MKKIALFIELAGISGGSFSSAEVGLAPILQVKVAELLAEFGMPLPAGEESARERIWVRAVPCPDGEYLRQTPEGLEGVVDINRFLIPGETRWGWVNPIHLIDGHVVEGLKAWAFADPGDKILRLYKPEVSAGRPGEGPSDARRAVLLQVVGAAFDIA